MRGGTYLMTNFLFSPIMIGLMSVTVLAISTNITDNKSQAYSQISDRNVYMAEYSENDATYSAGINDSSNNDLSGTTISLEISGQANLLPYASVSFGGDDSYTIPSYDNYDSDDFSYLLEYEYDESIISITSNTITAISSGSTTVSASITILNGNDTSNIVTTLTTSFIVNVSTPSVVSTPSWTWASDYSSAIAVFTLSNSTTEKINAVITSSTTPATCTEDGSTTYTATVSYNGSSYTDTKTESIKATGHTYDSGTITQAATEDSEGVITYTCTKCNQIKTEVIPKIYRQITITKKPVLKNTKIKKGHVTISWKKLTKKSLYKKIRNIELQYSTDPSFLSNNRIKHVSKKKSSVKIKLNRKRTYFFRIRYVGNSGAVSQWSKVKSARTK